MPSRFWLFLAFVAAFGPTPAQAQAGSKPPAVMLDQTAAKLSPGAATVIIGEAMVADLTMLKTSAAMAVTGKGHRRTNLIAPDADGTVLLEERLRVVPARTVAVLRNGPRTYPIRNPDCMPDGAAWRRRKEPQ